MNRLVFATGILALAAPLAMAQASTWVSDPAHSEVDFSIRHMTISTVRGEIGGVTATILYDQTDIARSSVKATISVGNVNTGESTRDSVVRGSQFFNVDAYPTATFTSTGVAKNGDHLTVNGNLTLHGVTKPVVLDVEGPTGPVMGMDHKPHSGFSATTTLSRTAFGIGSSFPEAIVGDEVKLDIEIEVIKQ